MFHRTKKVTYTLKVEINLDVLKQFDQDPKKYEKELRDHLTRSALDFMGRGGQVTRTLSQQG